MSAVVVRRRSGVPANLLLLVFGVAVALLLVEGAARVFVFFTPNVTVLDAQRGWTQRPNANRVYQTDEYRAEVETNAFGNRGPLYAGPKTKPRVLLLGDSFVAGLEVSERQLFSHLLDQAWPQLEFINAGVGGYGTVQQRLWLARLEPLLQPDALFLFVYHNDLDDNVMPFLGGIGPRPYAAPGEPLLALDWRLFEPLLPQFPGAAWLYRHSLAAYLLRNRVWVPLNEARIGEYIAGWRQRTPQAERWQVLEEQLTLLATGRQLVIVAVPSREAVAGADTVFGERLAAVAAGLDGVDFVDLRSALRAEHYFRSDIHWNPSGHRAVSRRLDEYLRASGLAVDLLAASQPCAG